MEKEIYLDNSATTAVADEVLQAMEPYWSIQYGNPSSPHLRGVAAEKTINSCRAQLGEILNTSPRELYFTASGTEANNLAVLGIANAPFLVRNPGHIITTPIEHPSVLNAVKHLEDLGWAVSYFTVDQYGKINPAELAELLRPDTKIVSVMFVNNELGTIAPIAELGGLIKQENRDRQHKIVFHADAVQALGQIELDIARLGADLLSFSGHKIFGPKGIGLLFARRGIGLRPIMFGGGQENGLRPGTENVPAIVGFTRAVRLVTKHQKKNNEHLAELRQALIEGIHTIPEAVINSPADGALQIINASFSGIRGEVLVHFLEQKRIFVAMGAACSSRRGVSHVLEAVRLPEERMISAIRFSLSPQLTLDQMEYVVYSLKQTVQEIRSIYM